MKVGKTLESIREFTQAVIEGTKEDITHFTDDHPFATGVIIGLAFLITINGVDISKLDSRVTEIENS